MVKQGTRALGIAESYRGSTSTLAGAVVDARGRTDGFAFATCTVGGLDATDSVLDIWKDLDREDIRYCLIGGVALAWFNIIDLERLATRLPIPVLAITFEESDGLRASIREAFDPEDVASRLALYERLPDRERLSLGSEELFVRAMQLGDQDPEELLAAYTRDDARPEPLRVARQAARAADRFRHRCG